ncbi:MAG: hypothetical protein V3T31_11160, partial [candidate division Zixibacteria bacterium]
DADDYRQSLPYLQAIRDSLGDDLEQREAQILIADAQFNSYRFADALGSYLQILGMDPLTPEKYHALYQSAQCSYRVLRIPDGLDYLNQLLEDELYFDSIDVIRLAIGEGYEIEEDLELAEAAYEEVAGTSGKGLFLAEANYRLGLIYQYDYDDLAQAKAYYDLARDKGRGLPPAVLALEKSSDIGKLDTYARTFTLDSTTTQDQIDQAAYTQYLLSELYWFQLNKPETAMVEMQYLIDSFPNAYDTPRAIIALSQMQREYYQSDQAADSMLRMVLTDYPRSDYIPEVLSLLGLHGTAADTGYAAALIHKAENFWVDNQQYDSAIYYYQYVADSFPSSVYSLQARFSTLWLQEEYLLPGDSSLYFAYQGLVDSFPGTEWAQKASRRIGRRARRELPVMQDVTSDSMVMPLDIDTTGLVSGLDGTDETYGDIQMQLWLRPNGDTVIWLRNMEPILIEEEFEFPTEAGNMEQDYTLLYFHVLLDFSGKVLRQELKTPSKWSELDILSARTVASMTFDAIDMGQIIEMNALPEDPGGEGHWFMYKYRIDKPDFLK